MCCTDGLLKNVSSTDRFVKPSHQKKYQHQQRTGERKQQNCCQISCYTAIVAVALFWGNLWPLGMSGRRLFPLLGECTLVPDGLMHLQDSGYRDQEHDSAKSTTLIYKMKCTLKENSSIKALKQKSSKKVIELTNQQA